VTTPPARGQDLGLIAYHTGRRSPAGQGSCVPDYSSEDHLVGYPGTADHGMPISAFTGPTSAGHLRSRRFFTRPRVPHRRRRSCGFRSNNPITRGNMQITSYRISFTVDLRCKSARSPARHAAHRAARSEADGDQVKSGDQRRGFDRFVYGAVPNEDFGWGSLPTVQSVSVDDRKPASRPHPKSSLPALRKRIGRSPRLIAALDWSPVSFGSCCTMSAAEPATCGLAT